MRVLFALLIVALGIVSVVVDAQAQSRGVLDAEQHEMERKSTELASKLWHKWMLANGRELRDVGILWSCKEKELSDAFLAALPDKRFEKLINDAVEAGEFNDLPNYSSFYVRQKILLYFLGYQEGVIVATDVLATKEQCAATVERGKSYLKR